MALTIFFIFCLKVPYYKGKKRSQAFFRKNSRSRETVPKRPKMAQNGPKMVVNRKFLENGSNDFPAFWPQVGGQYSKKVDPAGFFPKIPVFRILGQTVPKWPKMAKNDTNRCFSGKWLQGFPKFLCMKLGDQN